MFHLVTLPREQGETLIYLFKYNRGMGTQQKPTAHQHGHRDSVWGASHIPTLPTWHTRVGGRVASRSPASIAEARAKLRWQGQRQLQGGLHGSQSDAR